jgi:hypothetical protein
MELVWMMKVFKNSDTVMESSIGLMGLIMKVSGTSIKQKAKELSGMLKVMFITASSKMIWQMATESTLT